MRAAERCLPTNVVISAGRTVPVWGAAVLGMVIAPGQVKCRKFLVNGRSPGGLGSKPDRVPPSSYVGETACAYVGGIRGFPEVGGAGGCIRWRHRTGTIDRS
ncbi:hypothetical protein GCM10017559_06010 [Streptosporangium longisporum]|uniref:Uncharacterized protein n=1 Tax=Streptosporangium longisporum TaxID=46187 RepID=A0ABN3XQY1_9ACTN